MATGPDQPPSVWTRPPKKAPTLTRELIVATAIRVLDAEGLEALSMRRLGAELKTAATAFYWHVGGKDELIELVVDQVYGEIDIPVPDDPADWRTAAAGCARSLRAAILRHSWFASLTAETGLAFLGPQLMDKTDHMIGILEDAGFTLEEANLALGTLVSWVTGAGIAEAAWRNTLARKQLDEQDWMRRVWPLAVQAVQPYPRLRRLYATQSDPHGGPREDAFDYGLRRILASMEPASEA
ncbi:TetR/AcrR family transcriptional regulator [Nonomuraea sp. NPDC055795]